MHSHTCPHVEFALCSFFSRSFLGVCWGLALSFFALICPSQRGTYAWCDTCCTEPDNFSQPLLTSLILWSLSARCWAWMHLVSLAQCCAREGSLAGLCSKWCAVRDFGGSGTRNKSGTDQRRKGFFRQNLPPPNWFPCPSRHWMSQWEWAFYCPSFRRLHHHVFFFLCSDSPASVCTSCALSTLLQQDKIR